MTSELMQLGGLLLVLLTMLDVFLTVLYTRMGAGLFTPWICKRIWSVFRAGSFVLKRRRDLLLSFGGPVMLVTLVLFWGSLMVIGFALIYWPLLGSAVRTSSGPTPTDFIAAFYTSGFCFTTLGIGDLIPLSSAARFLMVAEAGLGFSFFTLSITYFLSIYNALSQRNTLASELHHKTGRTGNPAEVLARLGPGDDFSNAAPELSNISSGLSSLLEMHKHYPILHFYRFQQVHYALSRMVLVAMDTATFARSALDPEKHSKFINSYAILDLWNSGMSLQTVVTNSFLSPKQPQLPYYPDAETIELWESHFSTAMQRLEQAGIAVHPDRKAAFEHFVELRSEWYPHLQSLADYMRHTMEEIHHSDRGS